jgi:general secretion pathway protein D
MLAIAIVAGPLAIAGAAAAERPASYTFAFQAAPIAQVADEILGSALGLTFTVDPAVTGVMSFRIDRRLTRPQLLEAFEAALEANGVALVRDGDTLLLTPRDKAKGSTGVRMANEGRGRGGYEVVAVPLSYAAPSEVAKALEAIGPEKSVVYFNDKQGLLLLGGSGAQLQSAIETVKVFDQNGLQGAKIRWFPLTNASASTLASELDRILQASGAYGATVVPMKRLNGVFVFGRTSQILDDVAGWVSQLDVSSRDEAQSLWTYRPKNISAESLSRTLNSVLSGQSNVGVTSVSSDGQAAQAQSTEQTAQSVSFVASGEDAVRVGVDPESNTLLVSAPLARWRQIERILAEIDRRPSQILIEASILEVTLSDEFRLGVDWSVLANSGKLKITSTSDRQGVVGPTFPGFAVTFLGDDIRAAVNALGSRTNVEVVSAPKIVTVANRTAKLQVGDQVPIAVQSARSTSDPDAPLVTTTEYRNTGVILNVTPRISGENEVLLEISQEVSSVAKTTTSGIDSPTIQQRRMDSTLVLHDGGVVALGGLISSTRNDGASGIPGLKDVPGLGILFRSGGKDHRRTELIVLLTARIMRDAASSEGVMNDVKADMHEVQRRGLMPD